VWDVAAGNEADGRRWRGHDFALTYGCGAYRPCEDLVAQAAKPAGLDGAAPARLNAEWDGLKPWPKVPSVRTALRARGLELGVATNFSIPLGRRAAARCGVPFDAVITGEEGGFHTPRPEPYLAVLDALGMTPDEALFVAGSPSDVPGAARVGMPARLRQEPGRGKATSPVCASYSAPGWRGMD